MSQMDILFKLTPALLTMATLVIFILRLLYRLILRFHRHWEAFGCYAFIVSFDG